MKHKSRNKAIKKIALFLFLGLGSCENHSFLNDAGGVRDTNEDDEEEQPLFSPNEIECSDPESTSSPVVHELPPNPFPGTFRQMQLALARICVSEAGFQMRTLDCRLIYETLRYRSPGNVLSMSMMRAYSTKTFDRRRTDSRAWIPFLNERFTEPRNWERGTTLPWSTRRTGWRQVYEYAGYLLRYPQAYPCTVRVHHWGARGFRRRRHLREGWILVNCGETLNDFWSVPSRSFPERRVCNVAARVCE